MSKAKAKAPEEQANDLVDDYKARLSPYVSAMKDRGYFGEAIKLQAQQKNQGQVQNDQTHKPQADQLQMDSNRLRPGLMATLLGSVAWPTRA